MCGKGDKAHFIFVTIPGAQSFKAQLRILHFSVLTVAPEFPRTDMSAMPAVQDNAHALEPSIQRSSTKQPTDSPDSPPSPVGVPAHHGDDDRSQESSQNQENTQAHGEDDTGLVAVADGPANKVRVGLESKEALDVVSDVLHGRRMRRVGQGEEDRGPVPRGKVEFAGGSLGNVDGNDAGYLVPERLNRDYARSQCMSDANT